MLYTAIDSGQKRVVDVIPHGDATRFMQEYVELFNEITGQKLEKFDSLEQAKQACIQAVHDRTFGRPPVPVQQPRIRPPWVKEAGTTVQPTPTETEDLTESQRHLSTKDGPTARARAIFERMWGSPRKDIIEACAQAGVKRSTAATQYQSFKKMKESQTTVNPQNNMPQLAPGVQVGR